MTTDPTPPKGQAMPTPTARQVSAALRRAGVPVGYRYTQTGYTDRHGVRVTEPGCEVTSRRRARYGGTEDLGHVAVFPVDPSRGDSAAPPEFHAKVADVLRDAGFEITVTGLSVAVSERVVAR